MDFLCFFSVLCLLCLCALLFICALWSPAGKGLTSWLSFVVFNFEFVTFPIGIQGQVWYLIISIPDLYTLTYFYSIKRCHKLIAFKGCFDKKNRTRKDVNETLCPNPLLVKN